MALLPGDYEPFDVLKDLAKSTTPPDLASFERENELSAKLASLQEEAILAGLKQASQNNMATMQNSYGQTYAGTATSNTWTMPYAPMGQYDEKVEQANYLELAIEQCGNGFYYLVSPHATTGGDGLWHAKGRRAIGKGRSALEAVRDLITKLAPEDEQSE